MQESVSGGVSGAEIFEKVESGVSALGLGTCTVSLPYKVQKHRE